jgi:hypothetical protein
MLLTPFQISHIIRRRLAKIPTKVIAREINCTPNQVKHCWVKSKAYETISHRRHQANRKAKREDKSKVKWLAKIRIQAQRALRAEILKAKSEANITKPFKSGPLEW